MLGRLAFICGLMGGVLRTPKQKKQPDKRPTTLPGMGLLLCSRDIHMGVPGNATGKLGLLETSRAFLRVTFIFLHKTDAYH